ncbi:hypothetical protein V8E36_009396 [Tilletia maclaganii]
MRYNPPLAVLALALLAAATVKAQDDDNAACSNLCNKDAACFNACVRCHHAIDNGWLAKDAHSAPPSCQNCCGEDKTCNDNCHAYQNACCTPPFGCCPYDSRLCVCKLDSGVGC